MSIVSGFPVSLPQVELLGRAAIASFAGGAIPEGWSVVMPETLGVDQAYRDGPYFTNDGASAIVLQQGDSFIISFRGTDDSVDPYFFPQLATGDYIDNFDPLLGALAAVVPAGASFSFTGASLGGGATNQMADIAAGSYGGRFADATFVAFASPNISEASGILNFGFENDPVYRLIEGYGDSPSSLDNLVLATPEYMAGNYDGLHPYDAYAHSQSTLAFEAIARLDESSFSGQMTPDSVMIFDASDGLVQDVTPGRENVGAFYLGQLQNDQISGRNGNDHIEGFAGNDVLTGGAGADALAGGEGSDTIFSGDGDDSAYGGGGDDLVFGGNGDDVGAGGAGNDALYGGAGNDAYAGGDEADAIGGGVGSDTIYGSAGNDRAFGGADNDLVYGGTDTDKIYGGSGNDTIAAGSGNDEVGGGSGDDAIAAGSGADTLYGAAGSDTIAASDGADDVYAGSGNDLIYLGAGDGAADTYHTTADNGSDTVYGFEHGIDRLDLSASGFTSFRSLVISQDAAGDAVIDLGNGDSLVLGGIAPSTLDAGDFVF
ncbi:calcium-binding protein [Aurantimonas sp. VKM B-3413]|uniref:calcium-binding protein n=1 Tax=Aurantimonas sp. VKM B-3413 TaxID=2779401 RepID=UPI001E50B0B3|nr:calcium-binding protein [Aurantimonas sp. VKM B-3413]MCB8837125.1 hypothetical protein [Aurantimonas sp. VKM B-3413]